MANNILFFKEGLKNNKVYKEVGNMFGRDKRNALVQQSLYSTVIIVRKQLIKHMKRKLDIKKSNYLRVMTNFKFNPTEGSILVAFKDKNLRKQQDPTTLKSLDAFSIPDGPLKGKRITKARKPLAIINKIIAQQGKKTKRKRAKGYFAIVPKKGPTPKVLQLFTNKKPKRSSYKNPKNRLYGLDPKPGLYVRTKTNVERLYTFSDDAVYPRQRIDFENQGIQLFKKYFPKIFFNKARDILGFQFK